MKVGTVCENVCTWSAGWTDAITCWPPNCQTEGTAHSRVALSQTESK